MDEEPPTMDPFQECQEQIRNFEINDRPPSFRHSRAFRNFKNPPQPHMCIRDMTADGELEVLINVMSWTRIVKPQTPNDPIPLYGGMRVLASSSNNRSPTQLQQPPAMLFAVMANPEVLKKASRNSTDDQDLTALVELMCEFVEAMNPGLKLLRQPVVLKDRDLSGELKNIWGAVQAKRETEREHFMTGKSHNNPNLVVYTELGPETGASMAQENGTANQDEENGHHQQHGDDMDVGDYAAVQQRHNGMNSNSDNHKNAEESTDDPLNDKSLTDDSSNLSGNSNKNSCNGGVTLEDGIEGIRLTDEKDDTLEITGEQKNVPQVDQDKDSNGLDTNNSNNSMEKVVTDEKPNDPVERAVTVPAQIPVTIKSNGKAEKEVANVKEKKDKSISGFLQSSGLFGKRNKDKDKDRDNNGGQKEKSKAKLGSFKSKLLLSSSREKEDKGSEEKNAKKGGSEDKHFSEISQSMTTTK